MADIKPNLRCGIIGWSEPTLIKCHRFFPGTCNNGFECLRFLASKFPCVEVDTTHYAIPSERNVKEWLRATKDFDNFKFHVKIFGMFTMKRVKFGTLPWQVRNILSATRSYDSQAMVKWDDLSTEAKRTLWHVQNERLQLLRDAKKLGCVLFQFQLDFGPTEKSRSWVEYCRQQLDEQCLMAVEFRDRAWFKLQLRPSKEEALEPLRGTETTQWLRRLGIVQVIVDELIDELYGPGDEPSTDSGIAGTLVSTQLAVADPRAAYIRVHRRTGTKRLLAPEWHKLWADRLTNTLTPLTVGNSSGEHGAEPESGKSSLCSDATCSAQKLCALCRTLSGGHSAQPSSAGEPCPIYVVFGTAFEDQSVLNAQNLYKETGVSVAETWRSLNQRRALSGFFGKAAKFTKPKVGAASKEPKSQQGHNSVGNESGASLEHDVDPKPHVEEVEQRANEDEVEIVGESHAVGAESSRVESSPKPSPRASPSKPDRRKSHRTMSIAERFEMRRAAKKAQSSPKPTKRNSPSRMSIRERFAQRSRKQSPPAAQPVIVDLVSKPAKKKPRPESATENQEDES